MTTEIKVCMGSACFARGNDRNIEIIEGFIAENNLDATVEIVGSRCEGLCAEGPNIYIDDVRHTNVTEEKLETLLKELL